MDLEFLLSDELSDWWQHKLPSVKLYDPLPIVVVVVEFGGSPAPIPTYTTNWWQRWDSNPRPGA